MSGGSFNYLGLAVDLEDAVEKPAELRLMAEQLEVIAPGHPVTRYTRHLADSVFERLPEAVTRVWMAMEWWRSGDWSENSVRAALKVSEDWSPVALHPDHERLMAMEKRLHELVGEHPASGIVSVRRVRDAMAGTTKEEQ